MTRCNHLAWTAAVLALAAASATGASPALAGEAAVIAYSLPSQDLSTSIREVARASGRNIIAPADIVSGRTAPALQGRYEPAAALNRLLEGSGLRVEEVDGALVVADAGSLRVSSAPAQPGEASSDAQQDVIVVTGTNLRGGQPTAPVVVITRAEIDRTGATSVEQLMRTVPQNSQGGVNRENFGADVPGFDATEHGSGLNLRGLGQRATLVLVNGRRLAPSGSGAFVDVSLIPLSAVERVEILTDGASAIYGSDAVGGVVNFILRDHLEGLETSLQLGTATRGDGDQLQLAQTAGHSWTSGHAMLTYEYRLEDEIRAEDRPFTINLRPGTFLLPRERRHTVFGVLEQSVTDDLSVALNGSFSTRETNKTFFQTVSPLPVYGESKADSYTLTGGLNYELPHGWRARLDGNYALTATSQQQTQPGGNPLVNYRDTRNSQFETLLRIDGSLLDLPGGPVRVAVGAQARWERYREVFKSSQIAEITRTFDRTAQSVFGELLVPIFSERNRQPGFERLTLSAAARYDHYSGTGSTFDPRLGIAWSPVDGLDLRGAYSTSYRAPLLSEASGSYNVIYLPVQFVYADPSQAPAEGVAFTLQGSNPDIGPETSRSWTFGLDYKPSFARGLTLSANYYAIRFSDRIALPTSTIDIVGNPAFDSIVDTSPDVAELTQLLNGAVVVLDFTGPGFSDGGATPADVAVLVDTRYNNTAVTRTRGFDLGLRYAFGAGESQFAVDTTVTHIIAFEDRLTAASPATSGTDRPYYPADWRFRGSISWSLRALTGSLFLNHTDGYADDRAAIVRRVHAQSTVDGGLSYNFGPDASSWLRGTRVGLFVENLFDTAPPRLLPDPGRTTGLGYDPVNASARGRFVSFQVRRTW